MHITFFLNPFSGKAFYGFFSEERIKDILRKHLSSLHTFEIVSGVPPTFLEQKIKEIAFGSDVIVIVGGDGTIKTFADFFIPLYDELKAKGKNIPFLIPIGAGSLNVVAKNIVKNQTPGTAPRIVCDIVNNFNSWSDVDPLYIRKVRPLKIEEEGFSPNFGFMFANGLIFSAMEYYYSKGFGPEKALSLMLKSILSIIFGGELSHILKRFIDCEVQIDDFTFPHKKVVSCIISVFRKMVLFTTPFTHNYQKDKFFVAVFADPHIKLALNFLWIALGKKVLEKSFNGVAQNVKMTFEGGYTLDGEVFKREKTTLKISLGPELLFLTNEKQKGSQ
jgi:hypothetical protein